MLPLCMQPSTFTLHGLDPVNAHQSYCRLDSIMASLIPWQVSGPGNKANYGILVIGCYRTEWLGRNLT